jgi:hypothetical protein
MGKIDQIIRFVANDPIVIEFAIGILVMAIWVYLAKFRSPLVKLKAALLALAADLRKTEPNWSALKTSGRECCAKHEILRGPWNETELRVMQLPHGNSHVPVMFGPVHDVWEPNKMLRPTMNVALFEAMPNLLVGIGLLLTFFFLSLALSQATVALTSNAQDSAKITEATGNLLSTAGAKFTTSLFGLLASIVWTVFSKKVMANLARSCNSISEIIQRAVHVSGAEMATYGQLQSLYKLESDSKIQMETLTELLEESRERTGSLKRFETDLAVTIGNAVTRAFAPQMEDMTLKLVSAIDNLSKNLGSMNQDALQTMMKDFATMIKESTSEEMNAFKDSLGKLSERLNTASITLAEGAEKTSDGLDKAAQGLTESVGKGAQSLTDAAALLDAAMINAKASINDLDSTISNASDLGRAGAKQFELSLVQTEAVIQKMQLAKESWNEAISVLGKTAGTLSNAVDSLEELTAEQRGVVNAVKDATPNALQTVKQVSLLLEQTALGAEKAMHEARDAMERTGKTLGGTVSAITSGVEGYSKQLAELHQSLDTQVSKAVTSIGGAIVSLEEAVEELGEILEAKLPKQ